MSPKCLASTSVLIITLPSPRPKPPRAACPRWADPGDRTPTHRWHSQPHPLHSRSPSPRRSATRPAHTCGWWVHSSASLQDTPAWLWRQRSTWLSKGNTGHGANHPTAWLQSPCLRPRHLSETSYSMPQFLHLGSGPCLPLRLSESYIRRQCCPA